jgi:predicted dehydrogenase
VKFLVIGLGSMGKRRVRNLFTLGHQDVAGFDPRADRREEAKTRSGITVFDDFDHALKEWRPDALVISTPPDLHMRYAEPAVARGLPCFIEASVVDADRILRLAEHAEAAKVVVAPSCTMRYFGGPMTVKRLLREGVIGRPVLLNYQTGQFLPDWHPWEPISDFYVSCRETGGGREIVPFELTWLNDVFGNPEALACAKGHLSEVPADIDDVYLCTLRYPGNLLATLTVEVISRPVATRVLRVLGTEGQIVFDADEGCVRYSTLKNPDWAHVPLAKGNAENGYINPEEPYIAEMSDFVRAAAARDQSLYPNSLRDDWRVLQVLDHLEALT